MASRTQIARGNLTDWELGEDDMPRLAESQWTELID